MKVMNRIRNFLNKAMTVAAILSVNQGITASRAMAGECTDFKNVNSTQGSEFVFSSAVAVTTIKFSRSDSASAQTDTVVRSAGGKESSLKTTIPVGKYLGHTLSTTAVSQQDILTCAVPSESTDFDATNFTRFNTTNGSDVAVLFRSNATGTNAVFTLTFDWSGEVPNVKITCEEKGADFDYFGYLSDVQNGFTGELELGGESDVTNAFCDDLDSAVSNTDTCVDIVTCDAPYVSSSNEDLILSSQDGEDSGVSIFSGQLGSLTGSLRGIGTKGSGKQVRAARSALKVLAKYQVTVKSNPNNAELRRVLRRAIYIARVAGNSQTPVGLRKRYVAELQSRIKALKKLAA